MIAAKKQDLTEIHLDEATFRWMHNEDAMATDKLAEGIRNFAADARTLETMIRQQLLDGGDDQKNGTLPKH